VCETQTELQVEQHPDKTSIGRISRGFDFLGYHMSTDSFGLAEKTVAASVERVNQLYEQGAGAVRIGDYVRRWESWVRGGLVNHRHHQPQLSPDVIRRFLAGPIDTLASTATNQLQRSRNASVRPAQPSSP
jgi:diadenosine tetraphosphatase ApaH/serine/threonine PP2A family protein phosphatase